MRILVISDTHMPARAKVLPEIIKKEAGKSDCCLHCGDFITYSVFESLSSMVKTYGVCGNMDDITVKSKLPEKQVLKFEQVTLGLTHGEGHPDNLINYVKKKFKDEFSQIDIFVFGHSHNPSDCKIGEKIYFNPGSPTDRIIAPYLSYGILEINGKNIKTKVIKIE